MNTKMIFNFLQSKVKTSVAGVLLAASLLAGAHVEAQELPMIGEPPWTSFFSGNIQRDFEFGISTDGSMELYLMAKSKKRVGSSRTIRIDAQVLVDDADGKQLYKSLKDDEGFSTTLKPGLEHETVKFTAETKDDAKVEIIVKYERGKIILDGRILDRGKLDEGKLSFSFKVRVPAMYTNTYDDAKKAKARMRRDKFRFFRAKDGKRVSLKTYEKVKLLDEKNAKGGIKELSVDMDAQEGKMLVFSTEGKKGVLTLKHPRKEEEGKLWKGYEVIWQRPFEETEAKDALKPFVIEVK